MLKKTLIAAVATIAMCMSLIAMPALSEPQKPKDIKVVPGDTLIVRIPAEEKLGGVFIVDDQGRLHLPSLTGINIGAIPVVGLTTSQVEVEISKKLSEYYTNAEANVSLTSTAKYVSVYGRVTGTGAVQYRDDMKLLDVFVGSGQVADDADLEKITLYREGSDPVVVDVTDLLTGKDFKNNIPVSPGDYVIVPPTRPTQKIKIIALGSISAPGSVYVSRGSRLMDVFAQVGGSIGRAALGKTYVIRIAGETPQIIHCDIKSLMDRADMSQNIEMMDGDILFVPTTAKLDVMKAVGDVLDLNMLKKTLQTDF